MQGQQSRCSERNFSRARLQKMKLTRIDSYSLSHGSAAVKWMVCRLRDVDCSANGSSTRYLGRAVPKWVKNAYHGAVLQSN